MEWLDFPALSPWSQHDWTHPFMGTQLWITGHGQRAASNASVPNLQSNNLERASSPQKLPCPQAYGLEHSQMEKHMEKGKLTHPLIADFSKASNFCDQWPLAVWELALTKSQLQSLWLRSSVQVISQLWPSGNYKSISPESELIHAAQTQLCNSLCWWITAPHLSSHKRTPKSHQKPQLEVTWCI